ncbi:MAG: preprotein translocase subunit SecA [Alphaproteobacteria bacterium CG11_big_fil_rev_8_21_14_0_20_44_7]|nr:MAG: preprotein translocase subunit SecA [Alphaproteobacteria bacterium CG11_big_fil_rev_8_21_14_0_20_44_7]
MLGIAKKIFGSSNDKLLKPLWKTVAQINSFEEGLAALSDADLRAKTDEFKGLLAAGKTLQDILPEAFAVVREASKRTTGMRHFDVQLLGGIILHQGIIAEMKTGEGKTLVATLPVYLNALSGKGVHVVTVNDYLALRDSEWMGTIYKFLGLSVGCLVNELPEAERYAAYRCDILYGTNNEFGFDYLRDNLKFRKEAMVQREFNYAIVDEVDSILIDEARTPLIISGPTEDSSELYIKINKLIPLLREEDYEVDEKARSAMLTEIGTETMETLLAQNGLIEKGTGLYDVENVSVLHHVGQALRAHKLFTNDVDYIVKDNKVIIIDEFTGRMQEGRRFSEGLHQALEAKENVPIQRENQTLASITFQNYFRFYNKLAGMTGTALTEAQEFGDIYGLHVAEIPTHMEIARVDENDIIYRTAEEKYIAIVEAIEEAHKKNQPVLVGTVSIEKSELISDWLKKKKIPHEVLNAKQHEREAQIVAQAGRPGRVTIATNMAGRGTDIKLGGNPEMSDKQWDVEKEKEIVLEAGGLFVLGTERHESRRIDNQLRGRSGRQGDPGLSVFYLSLQDDLMRIFGSERIDGLLQKLGLKEGESITHSLVSKALETAQKKVEGRNYEIRKNLLKYDDVMNDQRKIIYKRRLEIMEAEDISAEIKGMRQDTIEDLVYSCIPEKSFADEWDVERLDRDLKYIFGVAMPVKDWANEESIAENEIIDRVQEIADALMLQKDAKFGAELMRAAEKQIMLITLDQIWKEHLHALDNLRQGIGLRAFGQKDPLNEYKKEAFGMFEAMLTNISEAVTQRMAHIEPRAVEVDHLEQRERSQQIKESRSFPDEAQEAQQGSVVRRIVKSEERDPANPESWGRVGRNEACPCGSGKKFKHCHGKLS